MGAITVLIWHIIPSVTMVICAIFLYAVYGNKRPINIIAYTFVIGGLAIMAISIRDFSQTKELFKLTTILTASLIYPLSFFYLFELMHPGWLNRRKIGYMYLPVFVTVLLLVIVHFTCRPLPPVIDYSRPSLFLTPEMILRVLLSGYLLIVIILFTHFTLRMQTHHQQEITSNFSYLENTSLTWVRIVGFMLAGYGIFLFISVSVPGQWTKFFTSSFLTFTPIMISTLALRQKILYEGSKNIDTKVSKEHTSSGKRTESIERLKQQLVRLLEVDEIYKDPDLTAEKICSIMGTNRTYLSQMINKDLNTTFFKLINSYRLNKALFYLKSPDHVSIPIKNIAEITGFKNVARFVTLFKEVYGMTPKEYRNEAS